MQERGEGNSEFIQFGWTHLSSSRHVIFQSASTDFIVINHEKGSSPLFLPRDPALLNLSEMSRVVSKAIFKG